MLPRKNGIRACSIDRTSPQCRPRATGVPEDRLVSAAVRARQLCRHVCSPASFWSCVSTAVVIWLGISRARMRKDGASC